MPRRIQAIPKDLIEMKEYLREAFDIQITPQIPDTHTAQFNKEILNSLVVTWEVSPPPNEDFIDIGDTFKLTVKVSNTYEHMGGLWQLYKLVPKVWFKDVKLAVTTTGYAVFSGETTPNTHFYNLVTVGAWLKPGQQVAQEIALVAKKQAVGADDPVEKIASITVTGKLDIEKFFTYGVSASIKAQIRNP